MEKTLGFNVLELSSNWENGVKILLDAGARETVDAGTTDHTCVLYFACHYNQPGILPMLFSAGCSPYLPVAAF